MKVFDKRQKEKWMYLLYFPLLFLYLEVVFHLYMGLELKYFAVFGGFALAAGLVPGIAACCFRFRIRNVVIPVLTLLVSVLFCVEMICRDILQQYYQLFSAAGTAAGNHLGDYRAAVTESLRTNWTGLVFLLVVPGAVCAVLHFRGPKKECGRLFSWKWIGSLALGCVCAHLVMLGMVQMFPWKGDVTPKKLYAVDTYTDDQVEQLGLITMLRLDVKHSVFGVSRDLTPESENLKKLAEASSGTAGDGQGKTEQGKTEQKKQGQEVQQKVDTSPNVMEIDFETSIQTAPNDEVKWLSQYFQSAVPSDKNEYTGMFEGYNVIFITVEGFSGYLVDEKLTPTLYRLTQDGFVFNRFYSALHFTSTSGGEFQNLTGLYPKDGFPVSMTETGKRGTFLPFTLANGLNSLGYRSTGYHFNENMYGRDLSHPNLGYEWRQASDCENPVAKEAGGDGSILWPQSDDYMIGQTVNDYTGAEPFHVYYLTLSGHLPYGYGSNAMSLKNQEAVAGLPYSDKTKAYLAANLELEKGLTRLVAELEKKQIDKKTVIVMAPDHIPYSDLDTLAELAGKSFGADTLEMLDEQMIDFEVYRNSLVIWSGSMEEAVQVDKPCCQVDILPTLLNLLGITYDSRLLSGTDILSGSQPLVVFSSHSWLTEKGLYNRFTGQFTPAEGVQMSRDETDKYVEQMKALAECRLSLAPMIIDNDYYRLLLQK